MAHPIRATNDKPHLWTSSKYDIIVNLPCPIQHPEQMKITVRTHDIIVSNGRVDPQTGKGCAAYTIAQFGTVQHEIGDMMPPSKQMTSYRSELVSYVSTMESFLLNNMAPTKPVNFLTVIKR